MDEIQSQIDEIVSRLDENDNSQQEISDNIDSSLSDIQSNVDEVSNSLEEVKPDIGQLQFPLSQDSIDLIGEVITNYNNDNPTGGVANRQVFTSSGTFTVPTGIKFVDVECVGGGGGGSDYSVSQLSGGGGGYSKKRIDLTGVSTVSVTIGAAGQGMSYSSSGPTYTASTSGGTTSFGSYLSVGGGASGDTTGAGGTATGGDINMPGQSSGNPLFFATDKVALPQGGNSFYGYGAPMVYVSLAEHNGANGTGYGGGGGLAKRYFSTTLNGGNGSAGVCIISY